MTLPANPALVHETLAAHGQAMPLTELSALLLQQGVLLSPQQLRKLAARFPQDFEL